MATEGGSLNHIAQTIYIDGITCDACIKIITKKFSKIPGVLMVVSVEKNGEATVHVSEKLSESVYAQALADTAYAVTGVS